MHKEIGLKNYETINIKIYLLKKREGWRDSATVSLQYGLNYGNKLRCILKNPKIHTQ